MNKKNNKKWFIVIIILVLIAILFGLIGFSKDSKVDTKLNLNEKKWIENNKKNVINVSIANDIPVFSKDGEGVFFDYIKELEEETNLSFNLISYDPTEKLVENDIYYEIVRQNDSSQVSDKDMVVFKDYYVLISKVSEKIIEPGDIINKSIGVLSDDLANVNYYISSENGVTYTLYKSNEELKNAIKNDEVDYITVPKTEYLDFILSNNLHIVYNITDMKNIYLLKTSNNIDKNLKSIVNKTFENYKNNNLESTYNDSLLSLILKENAVSEKQQADFLSKKYVFGYIENAPYTGFINNKLIGLDSTYLNSFSNVTKASFEIKKYRNVKDLSNALSKGYVDIAPNYYNYTNLSGEYVNSISPYDEEYVILAHKNKTDVVINSIKSLKNMKVYAVNSALSSYIENETKTDIKTYDKVSTLIKKVDKNSIIVLDKNIYEMYGNDNFQNYRIIFNDKENLNYGYKIRVDDTNLVFEDLFTTYMEIINYKQLYNVAWKNYLKDSKEISRVYIYIILGMACLLIIWILMKKKVKIKKMSKREQTIRYIDPLTSLKNRNYLNKNFKSWENNAIYPQAIVVINLNNLRHVNDVYGHEEGDKLIKLAANVLIRNQLDQSDIIRTDGNEYLIYLVGYEKSKVVSYMRKLYKELGELPYGYGATLGYSMIEDDIKTIDDAINEAVLEIRANKEMNNDKK